MAQVTGKKEYNTFVKGFISEATPLNFPEDSTIDESNFVLHRSGERTRRLGIDYEDGYSLVDTSSYLEGSEAPAYQSFVWKTTGATIGTVSILVVQHGRYLTFYNLGAGAVSSSPLNGGKSVLMFSDPTKAVDATVIFGDLVVAIGGRGVYVLRYDIDNDLITREYRPILVRDIWGVDDGLTVTERPSDFDNKHEYNLVNQGWGVLDSYSIYGYPFYKRFYQETGEAPSNADIVSVGKDPSEDQAFIPDLMKRFFFGTTPAPKGFFVIDVFRRGTSRHRLMIGDSIANKTVPESYMGTTWPPFIDKSDWEYEDRINKVSFNYDISQGGIETVASFAGRVWYSGASAEVRSPDDRSPNLESYIFFSQVVNSDENINQCYQENDPTSENAPDLLDSDGGALKIPDMQKVLKLVPLGRQLIVFASNGIWEISGGEANFSANNFEIRKVTGTTVVAVDSIVEAEGTLMFWAEEGIYALQPDNVSLRSGIQNITENSIQSWFLSLSPEDKQDARGVFDPADRKVRWLFGQKKNNRILTSKPYPYIYSEGIDPESTIEEALFVLYTEGVNVEPSLTGTLRDQIRFYDNYEPEGIDTTISTFDGELRTVQLSYDNYEPEGIDTDVVSISASIRDALIRYDNYEPEGIDTNVTAFSGSLG